MMKNQRKRNTIFTAVYISHIPIISIL